VLIIKCNRVISDYSLRETKSGEYVFLQKINDDSVIGISCRNGLNPFGKIISGNKDPSMLIARRWVNLTYEVQTPLLERTCDHNMSEGEIF
jgi:hypothetical protein